MQFNERIVQCKRCLRLTSYCKKIAKTKRKSFQSENYWGKPVPSFGPITAQFLIVGLAPAAHGANRTGRMFTGDRSGLWLYRALHKAGFANQPTSSSLDDGLKLINTRITAVNHCAPPDNKPSPEEIKNCSSYLKKELETMKNIKCILVLGKIAFDQTLKTLHEMGINPVSGKHKFQHLCDVLLSNKTHLIGSYHPSQQNTFTGRLTEPMFDQVFERALSIVVC